MIDKETITKRAVHEVLSNYWSQYKAHPWQTGFAFLFPALGTILISFVPPLILAKIIDTLTAKGEISIEPVYTYILLFAILWLFGEMFFRVGVYFLTKIEESGVNTLSKLVFKKISSHDYSFFTNNFVGSITKKGMGFSRNFELFTDTLVFSVMVNVLPLIFVVIVLWRYSPFIPLVLVACLAIVIAIAIPFIRKRAKLVFLRHTAGSKMMGRISDSITNMEAIKTFAKEANEYKIYGKHVDDYTEKLAAAIHYNNNRLDLILSPIYVGTNIIGLILAIYFAQKLHLQIGAIIIIFSYYIQITRVFWEINRTYRNIESSISEASEFTQMFVNPPQIKDIENPKTLKPLEANIRFVNVGFQYSENQANGDNFLKNFCLEIRNNERVGLVGPSGSGKTTITKLLLRFSDLQEGKITIDDQDIKEVTQTSLRTNISYVPQEPLLFHRTLFENIAYANEKATKEEVLQAAKLARADEFIEKLPLKYDTMVGERGIKLSGGQRQRIAIARSLLKKAPILILDEATSSLDSESEKYIQEGLWELMKDKTALVIAHRLSTIKHLDRIIVLKDGKIVQDGTHDELIKRKGLYAKLWSHQSGDSIE